MSAKNSAKTSFTNIEFIQSIIKLLFKIIYSMVTVNNLSNCNHLLKYMDLEGWQIYSLQNQLHKIIGFLGIKIYKVSIAIFIFLNIFNLVLMYY